MNVDPCLAAYGILAATTAPYLLARHSAIEETPGLGVATWLLAAGSVIVSWIAAGVSLVHHPGVVAQTVGVVVLGGLMARFSWAWIVTWRTIRSRRGRHAQAAVLLGRRDPDLDAVVVDSPEPMVYCLPDSRGGTVVVTTGARTALSPPELRAVLSHERAHLEGHHHLLIGLGQIIARALPVLVLFREVGRQVPRLLEMCADDTAARLHGRLTVAAAIATMSTRATPAAGLGAGGPAATLRALRLTTPAAKGWRDRATLAATLFCLATGPYLASLPPCPHPW